MTFAMDSTLAGGKEILKGEVRVGQSAATTFAHLDSVWADISPCAFVAGLEVVRLSPG